MNIEDEILGMSDAEKIKYLIQRVYDLEDKALILERTVEDFKAVIKTRIRKGTK